MMNYLKTLINQIFKRYKRAEGKNCPTPQSPLQLFIFKQLIILYVKKCLALIIRETYMSYVLIRYQVQCCLINL